MKKIISHNAIILVAAFSFMQFVGKAQSGVMEPGIGAVLYQGGLTRTDPVYSLRASGQFAEDMGAAFFEMSGGHSFVYNSTIKTMDFKRDSTVRRITTVPFMLVGLSLCIPPGTSDNLSHFRGPLLSVGGGVGFPDRSYAPTGIMKISLQGNYTGNGDKKLRIGCFARASFNFLFASDVPDYSSALEIGLRLEMYKVFSPE